MRTIPLVWKRAARFRRTGTEYPYISMFIGSTRETVESGGRAPVTRWVFPIGSIVVYWRYENTRESLYANLPLHRDF
jgi:hypothetical protein